MKAIDTTCSKRSMQLLLQGVAAPICFIIIWALVAPLFHLPPITDIFSAVGEMMRNGTYFHDVLISSIRAIAGFIIGFGLGTISGVLTGRYLKVFLLIGGLFLFLRWTPVLALVPITARVGGLGEGPKIFLISWACLFVSWAYTHVAITKLNPAFIWWSDSLGLNFKQRLLKVYAPAVSPALIGAARVSLAISLIVVVAAELSGTFQQGFFRDGLGYRISRAIETNRNDINIACIMSFGVLGLVMDLVLVQFVKRGLFWITRIDFYRTDA